MRTVYLDGETDFEGWRTAARQLCMEGQEPSRVHFIAGEVQANLFVDEVVPSPVPGRSLRVSKAFLGLAQDVILHRSASRFDLLYRLLWRLQSEPDLMKVTSDRDVREALELAKNVSRASHKMKAFVRFRPVPGQDNTYAAWFEPEHYIVDRIAPFFLRRFAGMRWSIHTPYRSAVWDGQALWLGPGGERSQVPQEDAGEDLWRAYYANIFNPARLNTRMMRQEMPQKYWHLLPEAHLLPELVRTAGARVQAMAEREPEAPRRKIPARQRPASG